MSDALVSIIIPLYNAENYIAQAIESVIKQTYKNWELIVINDGSIDNSLPVAKAFQSEKVRVLSQDNRGGSEARNYGLKEARGRYIQFLDADDLLSANKIDEQVKLLNANEGKIAYCPTIHFFDGEDYSRKEIVHDSYHIGYESPIEFLINLYGGYSSPGGMVTIHSWLTPRSIIDKAGMWNEKLSVDDDGEYFCRVVLNSGGIVYAENGVNYYRKYNNANNISSQRSRKAMESLFKSAELKKEYLLSKTENLYAKKALARLFREIEVSTFPCFIDLSQKASVSIKYLGGTKYTPVIGGPLLESINKILGWKIAKRIQYAFRRVYRIILDYRYVKLTN